MQNPREGVTETRCTNAFVPSPLFRGLVLFGSRPGVPLALHSGL
jgi:hypothetical protein